MHSSPAEQQDDVVVDRRRLGALLDMSRQSGAGLKTALSRLDEERVNGRAQLQAARQREQRLRADLAKQREHQRAGEQQTAALRHALQQAQRQRGAPSRPLRRQPPAPSPVAPPSPQPRARSAAAASSVGSPPAPSPSTPSSSPAAVDKSDAMREDLAEALHRRRVRARALARWAKAVREVELMGLSRQIAVHSAVQSAFRRWRRQRAWATLSSIADAAAPTFAQAVQHRLDSASPARELAWWREGTARVRAAAGATSRLALAHRRRWLRRGLRAWRSDARAARAADCGRGTALKRAIGVGELVASRSAMRAWREAVLRVVADDSNRRREAQLLSAMREADGSWRVRLGRADQAHTEAAAKAAADFMAENQRRADEAELLRAELGAERQALLDALNAQRKAEAEAAEAAEAEAAAAAATTRARADAEAEVTTRVAAELVAAEEVHEARLSAALSAATDEVRVEAEATISAAATAAEAAAAAEAAIAAAERRALCATLSDADGAAAMELVGARAALEQTVARAEDTTARAAAEADTLRVALRAAEARCVVRVQILALVPLASPKARFSHP